MSRYKISWDDGRTDRYDRAADVVDAIIDEYPDAIIWSESFGYEISSPSGVRMALDITDRLLVWPDFEAFVGVSGLGDDGSAAVASIRAEDDGEV